MVTSLLNSKSNSYTKFLALASALFLTSCASQNHSDNENVEATVVETKEYGALLEDDKQAVLPQDLGRLDYKEIAEKEKLRGLQEEFEEQSREPANSKTSDMLMDSNDQAETSTNTNATSEEITSTNNNNNGQLFDAKTVNVQKGDSLSSLASLHYGDYRYWKQIADLNPTLKDPNKIEVGMTLFLPKTPAPLAVKAVARKIASTPNKASETANETPIAVIPPEPVMTEEQLKAALEARSKVVVAEAKPVEENTYGLNEQAQEKTKIIEIQNEDKKVVAASNPVSTKAIPQRKPAQAAEEETLNSPNSSTNKNLSNLMGALGLILFVAVFLSFLFTKPQKSDE